MKTEELIIHRRALKKASENFDKEKMLMTEHVRDDAYHTKLAGKTAHQLKESLSYAVALLYGDNEEEYKTAEKIIEIILKLQDKDEKSSTFGLWSYYEEEPLSQMDAPDRNWADFMGKLLLEILFVHKNKLRKDLIPDIGYACRYACESILRRDEGVQYTNVAFTDSLVTIATGELLGEQRFFDYGLDKLKRFLAFETNNGGVFEYNSPCYPPLVIKDVATFLKFVKNKEARGYAKKINRLEWKMIAEHFRADMLRISAPQSRAYSDFLENSLLYGIELACEGEVEFECEKMATIETFWTKAFCPPDLRGYFKGSLKPQSAEKLIMRGFNYPFFAFSQVASTYHCDEFSLGTYNREELWNQRRPLMAYIKNDGKPYCFRIRCLHDDYDFSSAQLHCVQEKSSVLGAVNFSCDRGDTHIGLDNTLNSEYNELAVSFELEGDMSKVSTEEADGALKLSFAGVNVCINIVAAKFGGNNIRYKLSRTENKIIYKVVLYGGERKKINLKNTDSAYMCFTLDFEECAAKTDFSENGEFINVERSVFGKKLSVCTHKNVMPFINMMYEDKQYKDGVLLERIAENNMFKERIAENE